MKLPQRRAELEAILQELSDADIQRREWLGGEGKALGDSGIDLVVHFLFDDTDLGENAAATIGEVLFDLREAEAVASLAAVLDSMITRLGDTTSKEYVTDSEWPKVMERAKIASNILARGDSGT